MSDDTVERAQSATRIFRQIQALARSDYGGNTNATTRQGAGVRDRSRGPSQAARSFSGMARDDPSTTDPEGRLVVFDAGTRQHLALGRPDPMDQVDLILGAVGHPDHRAPDPPPGHEHFYRRHVDPRRRLRVVVDFSEEPAWVVTALFRQNPPRGWRT